MVWMWPLPRIITFSVGNPYEPSFTTVTGRGPHPTNGFLIWYTDSSARSVWGKLIWVSHIVFKMVGSSIKYCRQPFSLPELLGLFFFVGMVGPFLPWDSSPFYHHLGNGLNLFRICLRWFCPFYHRIHHHHHEICIWGICVLLFPALEEANPRLLSFIFAVRQDWNLLQSQAQSSGNRNFTSYFSAYLKGRPKPVVHTWGYFCGKSQGWILMHKLKTPTTGLSEKTITTMNAFLERRHNPLR